MEYRNNFKGLTESEVRLRIQMGLSNVDSSPKPKSLKMVLRDNFFTLFNFVNLILALMIFFTGSLRNLMFIIVAMCNSVISLFQEMRARSATNRLKLISSKNVSVVRNGKSFVIPAIEVVLDDIVVIASGEQVVVDCDVLNGSCESNESLLTGEPNLIVKEIGDKLFAGSFVVTGKVFCKATSVGMNTYSAKISKRLKNIESAKSEIMLTVNKIIKLVSFVIIPTGIPVFVKQFRISGSYAPAALYTGAALIGMIPEGLALLTSSVLAVGASRLARKKVLAKDIYSVEALARIDTLCLDKTGTITENKFEIIKIVTAEEIKTEIASSEDELRAAIYHFTAAFDDGNETFRAIKNTFQSNIYIKPESVVPFASERKFSAAFYNDYGSCIIGSAEFIFKDNSIVNLLSRFSNYRVLAVGYSKNKVKKDFIPADTRFLGIILIMDKIRANANETIEFFKKNEIDIKIISGDAVETVVKIGRAIGIKDCERAVDARNLENFLDVIKAAREYTIFGRVTPEKKREIIKALKIKGHRVAMTGDGVNDVLALKEADCSVAMASGSSAAREVSHLILMDSDFSSIPIAVTEGRKAINNIITTSSLFLVKTIYSIILAVLMLIFAFPYPFLPIQMSLVSTVAVGIPSFLLAFQTGIKKVKGSVFSNIIRVSLPAALAVCFNLILFFFARSWFGIPREVYSSIASVSTGVLSLALLYYVCTPLSRFRSFIFYGSAVCFAIAVLVFGNIFSIISPIYWGKHLITSVFICLISLFAYKLIN